MGAEIDRLEVQVEAQAKSANQQLDKLISKLEKVQSTLGGVNASGLTGFANGINKIAGASAKLGNVKTSDFTRLAKNLEKIAGVDQASLNRTASSLTTISKSLGTLGGVSKSALQISELAKNISKLGNKSVQGAIENMPRLATSLNEMMSTLSRAPMVSSSLIQMTNALANLSAQGSKVGTALSSMGAKGTKSTSSLTGWLGKLTTSTGRATKATRSFAQMSGSFYANFYMAMRGIRKAWGATKSSMDFLETVNYFEVAMRKIGKDAVAVWDGNGHESAEAYAKSFSDRAKQLTAKMTGFNVDENGNTTYTGDKNLGMNPDDVMQWQAVYAQMTDSLGIAEESTLNFSKALTMLGADWASLRNLSFDTAWNKFASALAGQSRAVRSLGIDITQTTLQEYAYKYGLSQAVSEMNQATKAQLRLLAILDQSQVAWGDLANTMESPSNQLRLLQQNFANLARAIGNIFLPIVSKVLPYVNGLVMAMQRLFTWIGSLLGIKFNSINSSIGGMDNGIEDLVGGADDAEDSLSGANDAAKKLKNTVLGFDELNQLNDNDSSSGGSGSGGGGIGGGSALLDEEIANALAEYQKAWDEAFAKMDNKAQEVADRICNAFKRGDYEGIGRYISTGITKGLDAIEWNKVYSVAKDFGKGFAEFLNGLISPSLFGTVGKTIAGALNTAIYGQLSFGENFDFTNFGDSIAAGINGFFGTYDFKALAKTFNVWAKGILDTIIAALDNTDWDMIGTQIGTFLAELDFMEVGKKLGKALWKAINAGFKTLGGMFDAAPIETALLTTLKLGSAFNSIFGTKGFAGLGKALKKFNLFSKAVDLSTSALKGNTTSMLKLTNEFPDVSKGLTKIASSFSKIKTSITGGNFWGSLKNSIGNIKNSMTGLQKGVIGTVAVFGEFKLVNSGFYDLASGADNLGAAIGKIAIGAGAAVAALKLIGLSNPWTAIITGVVGVAGAINGINEAFEEIKAKEVGEAIYRAFNSPGGTPVSELANGLSDTFKNATLGFQELNNASESVISTNKNIQSVVSEIGQIKTAMDLGVLSVEDGKNQLDNLFGQLVELTGQKMSALTSYLLGLYGEGGALTHAYSETEYSAQQVTDAVIRTKYATTDAAQAIYDKMKETDFGSSEWNELFQQLLNTSSGMEDFEKAAFVFSDNINSINIDWGKLVGSDGTINTKYLDGLLADVSTSLEGYQAELDEAETNTKLYWEEMLANAATPEDKALFQQLLDDVPRQFGSMREDASLEVTRFTNMLHRDFIVKTGEALENAEKEFDKKNSGDKFWGNLTKEEYVQDAIDKQTENMSKFSDSIGNSFGEIVTDTADWSDDFHEALYGNLFDTNIEYLDMGVEKVTTTLKENYNDILIDIANGVDGEETGKKIHEDINTGLSSDIGSTANAMKPMITEIGTTLGNTSAAFSSLSGNVESTTESSKNSVASFSESSQDDLNSITTSLGATKDSFGLLGDKANSLTGLPKSNILNFTSSANSNFSSTQNTASGLMGALDDTTESAKNLHNQSGKTFEIKSDNDSFNRINSALNGILESIQSIFNYNGRTLSIGAGISGVVSGITTGIKGYANGGFPETGELFMTRENGINEMVGRFGNHSAVANNDQIVAGIQSGVEAAMVNVMMAFAGQQGKTTSEPVIENVLKVDSEELYRMVQRGREKHDSRYHVVTEI